MMIFTLQYSVRAMVLQLVHIGMFTSSSTKLNNLYHDFIFPLYEKKSFTFHLNSVACRKTAKIPKKKCIY
jgi:hypothetical protein